MCCEMDKHHTTTLTSLQICFHRFSFDVQTFTYTEEASTYVSRQERVCWLRVRSVPRHHPFRQKNASSGHYYAIPTRSEPRQWKIIEDSQIKEVKEPQVALLSGNSPEELVDHNAYILSLRCKQVSGSTLRLTDYVKKEHKK